MIFFKKIGNLGLSQRQTLTEASKVLHLEGPLMCPVLQTENYLLSNIDVHIKMLPSSTTFRLMSAAEKPAYDVKILSAEMVVAQVKVSDPLLIAHQETLKAGNLAQYR